jgi:hypothetical protein
MSNHATILKQTSKKDRQRKLDERLTYFNKKAEEYMREIVEDPDILPQYTGLEKDDDGNGNPWEEEDDEEEENSQKPEAMPICMPSSLKRDVIQRLGLEILASQELELRKGQASDCLQSLRIALGHKAALYRTKRKTSTEKTRASADIKTQSSKTRKHIRAYRRARKALERLGANDATLLQYQELRSEHLRLSGDITEENRVGQRSETLPWFWRLDGQNPEQHDTWMQECTFIFVCGCHY